MRRSTIPLAFILLASLMLGAQAHANQMQHGLSIFGELAYPPDFPHFAYVNPSAPKGGELSLIPTRTAYNANPRHFDSLNGYILKGNAAVALHLLFDSLMTRAWDEPDAVYGLVAKGVELSDDKRRAVFYLRPQARFADNSKLDAQDVAFSLRLLKEKGHPLIAQQLRHMTHVRALNSEQVEVQLAQDAPKSLLLFIATLPIFSKQFYQTHDFTKTTLDAPLGSGPYKVAEMKPGQTIRFQRRADYWAQHLPVNRGKWNFDRIRFEYFRDDAAEFEAFASGDYRLREEFVSKNWATRYDFPAIQRGEVLRLVLPDGRPSGAQGWFVNMRRDKFKDPKLREALALAFDFAWTNKHLFHNLYIQTESFFDNSAMRAQGKPDGAETRLLRGAGKDVPQSAFGEALRPPQADGSGQDRRLLRRAAKLLKEAGWNIVDGKRTNQRGEVLQIEFLLLQQGFERIVAPYAKNLRLLGIEASARLVDPAQYQERLKRFDFDISVSRFTIANTPGPELRAFFHSSQATQEGSYNLSGIANPSVDFLVEQVIHAKTREQQITAARALDRVLRALHIWIPQWHKPTFFIAHWQGYQRPPTQPPYDRAILETWWYEALVP